MSELQGLAISLLLALVVGVCVGLLFVAEHHDRRIEALEAEQST